MKLGGWNTWKLFRVCSKGHPGIPASQLLCLSFLYGLNNLFDSLKYCTIIHKWAKVKENNPFKGGNVMKRIFKMSWILLLLSLTLFLIGNAVAQETGSITVESADVCENIVDREPGNTGTSFAVTVEKLFFFTKIIGAENPVEIVHVWYFGDTERARVTLPVKANTWRTHSSKILQAHEIGAWHVDVLGPAGEVLETVQFEVVQ